MRALQLALVLDDADSGEHGSSDDRLGRLRAARILASGDGMNDGPGRHDDERGAAGGAQKQQQGRRRAHGFGCTRVKDTARRWKFVEVPGLSRKQRKEQPQPFGTSLRTSVVANN